MIELTDVHVRFGQREVLRGVTVSLSERRVGVIGANGSGKSTLARLVNGLALPTSGSVTVLGHDTRRHAARIRRRVGFLFTDPDAQIVMPTVAEDVAFSLRRRKLPGEEVRRRVTAVLERYGLAGHADHPAHHLSGGQKQLLALCSVLVLEPEILVMDEPTTLLDLRHSRLVADALRDLPQQVVVVSHDLALLEDFDRVLVLDEGRIMVDAPPGTAIDHYRKIMS
ncbi:energy-coupling factor ABC transporter ATP-binding protein [Streptosporangium sp. NBC_01756]|uniref:energy-coupling factor ABC transporter ATP-binding protein n=1 Tax=Streptosporangium sp. NBC_01756 TaxID=2975950 RepID=UPI002DD8AE9C|nr:ABC transporter ATP-binding protein [Streptosporangium sp. NBC_01756]WSC85963.1 energy-coupling factor ABC transporter ATP-binding protein [Streptosporangium sp. NBC_01756]